jgi:hypothetical protein
MHQQLWVYKVKEKLYLGVREQKRLNTTDLKDYETPFKLPCVALISAHCVICFE